MEVAAPLRRREAVSTMARRRSKKPASNFARNFDPPPPPLPLAHAASGLVDLDKNLMHFATLRPGTSSCDISVVMTMYLAVLFLFCLYLCSIGVATPNTTFACLSDLELLYRRRVHMLELECSVEQGERFSRAESDPRSLEGWKERLDSSRGWSGPLVVCCCYF